MRTSILLMAILMIISACCLATKPAGQTIASENNFENGVKQFENGHIKQAIHEFEKAIEKNPANFKAYYYLGLCYKHQGAMETAHKHFQKAIDLNPNDESWVIKVKAEMGNEGTGKDKKK